MSYYTLERLGYNENFTSNDSKDSDDPLKWPGHWTTCYEDHECCASLNKPYYKNCANECIKNDCEDSELSQTGEPMRWVGTGNKDCGHWKFQGFCSYGPCGIKGCCDNSSGGVKCNDYDEDKKNFTNLDVYCNAVDLLVDVKDAPPIYQAGNVSDPDKISCQLINIPGKWETFCPKFKEKLEKVNKKSGLFSCKNVPGSGPLSARTGEFIFNCTSPVAKHFSLGCEQ